VPSEIWTQFHYLYRDAGNFKIFGAVTLIGSLNQKTRDMIISAMDIDGRFVAEQIGVPALYRVLYQHTNGPSVVDVCTHEFSHFEEMHLESSPSNCYIWGNAKDFAASFENIGAWSLDMSPNAEKLLEPHTQIFKQ
jgi:hypothetical protein